MRIRKYTFFPSKKNIKNKKKLKHSRKCDVTTIKVVDSRPVRSAGRVKKVASKLLKIFVCDEGSILSSVIKIHPVFLADEFSISKNTHNANFTKMWLKEAF